MTLASLIETVGIGTVILVLVVCLPIIFNFLEKVMKLKKEQDKKKEELKQEGAQMQEQKDILEQRLEAGSKRMEALEAHDAKMEELLENQQKEIALLLQSDKMDIKAYITEKYYYYQNKPYINAEIMDILEQRFAIYQIEGGDSFIERMMDELRQKPLVDPNK